METIFWEKLVDERKKNKTIPNTPTKVPSTPHPNFPYVIPSTTMNITSAPTLKLIPSTLTLQPSFITPDLADASKFIKYTHTTLSSGDDILSLYKNAYSQALQ